MNWWEDKDPCRFDEIEKEEMWRNEDHWEIDREEETDREWRNVLGPIESFQSDIREKLRILPENLPREDPKYIEDKYIGNLFYSWDLHGNKDLHCDNVHMALSIDHEKNMNSIQMLLSLNYKCQDNSSREHTIDWTTMFDRRSEPAGQKRNAILWIFDIERVEDPNPDWDCPSIWNSSKRIIEVFCSVYVQKSEMFRWDQWKTTNCFGQTQSILEKESREENSSMVRRESVVAPLNNHQRPSIIEREMRGELIISNKRFLSTSRTNRLSFTELSVPFLRRKTDPMNRGRSITSSIISTTILFTLSGMDIRPRFQDFGETKDRKKFERTERLFPEREREQWKRIVRFDTNGIRSRQMWMRTEKMEMMFRRILTKEVKQELMRDDSSVVVNGRNENIDHQWNFFTILSIETKKNFYSTSISVRTRRIKIMPMTTIETLKIETSITIPVEHSRVKQFCVLTNSWRVSMKSVCSVETGSLMFVEIALIFGWSIRGIGCLTRIRVRTPKQIGFIVTSAFAMTKILSTFVSISTSESSIETFFDSIR